METIYKLCSNLRSCRIRFIELKHLDHNPQTILELVEQFLRKLTLFAFSTSPGKCGKGSQILGKDHKLVLSPLTGLKSCWNFATIYIILGPTVLLYANGSETVLAEIVYGWLGHEKKLACLTLTPTYFCSDVIKMAIFNYMNNLKHLWSMNQ